MDGRGSGRELKCVREYLERFRAKWMPVRVKKTRQKDRLSARRSASLGGAAPGRARHARTNPARRFEARFGMDLRSARQFGQHAQGLDNRALAHRAASDGTEAAFAMQNSAVASSHGQMDKTHRLAR